MRQYNLKSFQAFCRYFMLGIGLLMATQTTYGEFAMSIPNAYFFEFDGMNGETIKLGDFTGKVILVVNTASQCGFTPQYGELEILYEKYKDKGFLVIGVPSNNFGNQEFATEKEVKTFTHTKYAITFPLTAITNVKGENAHPFYQWAKNQVGFIGSPKWNFHKYLIDKNGHLVEWFSSKTSPTSKKITAAVEKALAS